MANPEFRAVSASVTIPSQGNGSVSVTKPTGTVDGDYVLLVCFTGNDSSLANVAPAGFTSLQVINNGAFNSGVRVFGKVASSEGASWSLTEGASNSQGNAFAIAYSNPGGTPINAITASAQQNSTTAPAFPTLTTTQIGKLIGIAFEYNNRAATITAAGSMTSRIAVSGARSYGCFDEDIATTGSISGRTATSSVSGDFYAVSILLAGPVTAPVITGPSGSAGAGSSTANLAEVATTGPTFTTSVALGGGYPTLTGADAASFAITALSSTSWRVDPVTPFNFESLPHSNPFNVTFNASASVSQTCAITVTNVNEAPGFSGTISVPGLTESAAMSAINAALLFSDPDSGDTGTYSAVGTFPTGVTVSSGGLISGTPGAGTAATYSSLRVRRMDGGGLTADSNVFSITVSASGAPPGVTTQPSNQTVTEGGVATFTAAFSNSPTGFAWEFADAPYSSWSPVVGGSGAATASYTTGALLLANNARRFRCTGTNAFGSTTTNGAAQVTVNAASGLAGFDFHSTVGCRFGAIAGSLVGLAPEVGVSIVIRVYNASTGALVATLPAAVTNSSGYLPRATHASLVAATSYTLNAVWPDGAVYAFNMVAT